MCSGKNPAFLTLIKM